MYTLVIYPITQIIELTYIAIDNTFNVHGVSILGVSIAVTLLTLPLYAVAENIQQRERKKQAALSFWVAHIKKNFSGDERFLMTQYYYRENHYHPLMALRALAPLAVQVPFFIAAYIFLSTPGLLNGSNFLFISDLSKPDGLLKVGSFSVNILPILMTAINVVASLIYTSDENFSLKDKLQLHLMALVFLLILYQSPSGLVLYWTANNIFSLVKNVYYKFKNPLRALFITMVAFFVAIDVYFVVTGTALEKSGYIIALSIVIPLVPLALKILRATLISNNVRMSEENGTRNLIYFLSSLVCVLFVGFLTPSLVIVSSPQEFSFVDSYSSPLFFLFNTFCQALGVFVFWPLVVYVLSPKKFQSALCVGFLVIAISVLINALFFPSDYGSLNPLLVFESELGVHDSVGTKVLNNAMMLLVIVVVFVTFYYRLAKYIPAALGTVVFVLVLMGVINTVKIEQSYLSLKAVYNPAAEKVALASEEEGEKLSPIFHLSKTRPNVLIFMLDRAISGFVPTIFEEDESLKKAFSGFVYYPNTLSFGFYTLEGAPPLFGGYEYTPLAINKRKNQPLLEKHNEALAVLPRLFSQNGFSATITDAPWANYSWISDMSYMARYPEKIRTLHTLRVYKDYWQAQHGQQAQNVQSTLDKRNFIWYSLMCALPCSLRRAVYNDGDYWAAASVQSRNSTFLNSYSVLDLLPELTATDADENFSQDSEEGELSGTFTFITNDITHDAVRCQAPDYIPVDTVTNEGETIFGGNEQYHANASAFHVLKKFMESLKAEGVYDNTRIIFVSDHGRAVKTNVFRKERKLPFMREFCNPLLFVKDFGATGEVHTSNAFMTNADVPSIATAAIIADAKNPFTAKSLNSPGVKDGGVVITSTHNWVPNQHSKNTFSIAAGDWYLVKNNIFDEGNWQQIKIKK